MKSKSGQIYRCSCGHCEQCKRARSREWSLRLTHELAAHPRSMFLTLTYDDDHLKGWVLSPTLDKVDIYTFLTSMKARCKYIHLPLSYYGCGEYGDKYGRPHYHVILFGIDNTIFTEERLTEFWGQGDVQLDFVNLKVIHYVTGYVRKKLYKNHLKQDVYGERLAPFSFCTRGLGLEHAKKNRYLINNTKSCTLNGERVSIPRYYLKKGIVDQNLIDSINAESRKVEYQRYASWCTQNPGKGLDDYHVYCRMQDLQHNVNLAAKAAQKEDKL